MSSLSLPPNSPARPPTLGPCARRSFIRAAQQAASANSAEEHIVPTTPYDRFLARLPRSSAEPRAEQAPERGGDEQGGEQGDEQGDEQGEERGGEPAATHSRPWHLYTTSSADSPDGVSFASAGVFGMSDVFSPLSGTNLSTDLTSFASLDATLMAPAALRAALRRLIPTLESLKLNGTLSLRYRVGLSLAKVYACALPQPK